MKKLALLLVLSAGCASPALPDLTDAHPASAAAAEAPYRPASETLALGDTSAAEPQASQHSPASGDSTMQGHDHHGHH